MRGLSVAATKVRGSCVETPKTRLARKRVPKIAFGSP